MPKQQTYLYKKIEHYISDLVHSGQLQRGNPLPTERKMGEMFNASRIPVRQALRKLEGLGLVERIQGKGTFLKAVQSLDKKVRTNRIGILYTYPDFDFFQSPTHAGLLAGIDSEARSENKDLLFRSLAGMKLENMTDSIHGLTADVDGILLVDTTQRAYDAVIEKAICLSSKPVVVLFYEGSAPSLDYLMADSRNDTRLVVDFLADRGHRRIGCVFTIESFDNSIRPSLNNRVRAFKEAMTDRELELNDNLIVKTIRGAPENQLKSLMALPYPPTALFCTTAYIAKSLYQAAEKLGLRIPDDISIVGYDDFFDENSLTPSLTTVRLPLFEIGAAGVKRLMEKIEEGEQGKLTHRTTTFPGTLVIRNSHKRM